MSTRSLMAGGSSGSFITTARPAVQWRAQLVPGRGGSRAVCAAVGRRTLLQGATAGALLLAPRPSRAEEAMLDAAAPPAEPAAAAPPADAGAAEAPPPPEAAAPPTPAAPSSSGRGGAPSVYLDVKLEGQKLGRISIELLPGAAPVGAARFADLAVGREGVGYRLARFDKVTESYVRNEGVKSLSYTAEGRSPIAGGDSTQALEDEMASPAALRHSGGGLVSLVVKEEREREVTERLVAMGGRLVTVQNVAGEAPNGTSFIITTGPAPELDRYCLVVGRVTGGGDVVRQLAALPRSKPRDDWFDKPFFETGKAIGDKRAIVAERGFNRPFKRAVVSSGGIDS